ncbi:WD40 repeat domain-containing protein [Kitasatospora sp. NPDC049258]|uniref:WD40 repeat domain-containing protein n=1 Tax=Kitasatospora sp. NPDC049258 TaxID=3155394 RepID=UPI003413CB80
MGAQGSRIPPLRAGRRPAGLALLGWLGDGRAPRLCQVTGSPGAGKSHLLSWLAEGGAGVRAVLPAAGATVESAAWLLGRRLDLLVRTPEELFAALAEDDRPTVICVPELGRAVDPAELVAELLDPLLRLARIRLVVEGGAGAFTAVTEPAVLDLDLPQWTDPARFAAWCAATGADPTRYPSPGAALGHPAEPAPRSLAELAGQLPAGPDGALDPAAAGPALLTELWRAAAREDGVDRLLGDARLLTLADPVAVSAALGGRPGTLPEQWRAAAPALIEEPDPGVRAAVLRTRLIGLDGPAADRLAGVPAPWRCAWAMWPDSAFGWPGPVASLAPGAGSYAGQLLLADPGGTVRTVDAASGRPLARVPTPGPRPLRGLTVTPGGSVVLLDSWGESAVLPSSAEADSRPGAALADLVAAAGTPPSAVAAVPGLAGALPALGDEAGALHWRAAGGELCTDRPHRGPVTALAAALQDGGPVLVSGGFDGSVQLWRPGTGAPAELLERRERVVSAVAVACAADGLTVAAAWADGLVRLRRPGAEPIELRLGSPVWALALAGGLLVLGTSDGIAAVRAG